MLKTAKKLLSGLLNGENRALIVGAGLLIAGAFLGLLGAVTGNVALLIVGAVLTVVSMYITAAAFLRYQWAGIVEDAQMYYDMSKTATADALLEAERRKNERR